MKHRYGSISANLDRPSNPELILWAQLFHSASSDLGHENLADGKLLYKIFQQLDGKSQDESALCESVESMKDRLSNWHFLMQNVRNYYLEVLQEVITFRPPNLVLISKSPDCALAHSEMDQILLLLLCAAVRCERRDYFIRQIMDHLNPDVQAGLMNCIKNARCEQLSGDLAMLTKEQCKQKDDLDDKDNVTMKQVILEQELAKARIRLAETEQLRSADLDELKTLREELGRLRLEQCTLARTSSDGNCQPVKDSSVKTDNIVLDLSDNDMSESQRELSQASGCDRITPNLSTQLAESVASRLNRLEADNCRLITELSIAHDCASAAAAKSTEELADARAGLAEFKRANQLLTDKLKRLETLVATQTDRIKQLESERRAAESETRKAREALIFLQESTDHQVAELSKENNLLTETMEVSPFWLR
ncbi:hypothetical protein AHF37_01045 [Paragonimus kellicotti]|nr:hypothetical protein AHF37_01045 [Paragonimus kellicotti]